MSYGGTDLSQHGLQVNEYDIPEMAPVVFKTHKAIFGDSEMTSVSHTTRTINAVLSVTGTSKANLQARMDSVMGLLNPLLTDKVITFDDIDDRRFVGRTKSVSPPTTKGRWGRVFSVVFECMAHRQALGEINASIAIATDPDTLAIASVTGNVNRIPCEFYMRNETGSSLTNATISLQNATTSETLTWRGTLEDDRWLRFGTLDSNGRFQATIEKSNSTGSDPEAEAYTSVESGYVSGDWPRLQGGAANSMVVTGISTGTLESTYRGRYL
jgi:predicted phage tail component-like protein